MANAKTVLIAAGGTGGHVFPGLALAHELQRRGAYVHWLGTTAGIESRLVKNAGIPLHCVGVKGIRGKGRAALLMAPMNILKSIWQASRIVKTVNPGLVVGLGGFVAGPGGIAARLARIPLIIHEQNAVAGTTNKLLSRLAKKVLTAFPGVLADGVCIGNPVREDFFKSVPVQSLLTERPVRVLVVGGSRGARAINQFLPKVLNQLGGDKTRLTVLHQTGETLLEETKAGYAQLAIDISEETSDEWFAGEVRLAAFIEDMAASFHWADLVVCRAGALTISELAAAGVASVLIPFPYAIDDHQTCNAEFLVNAGAAIMWQQRDLNSKVFANTLKQFIASRQVLEEMGHAARACASPGAVSEFADWCDRLYRAKAVIG